MLIDRSMFASALESRDRARGESTAKMTIPTLDASSLHSNSEEDLARFRADLLFELRRTGFVKLVNHTVSTPLVQETFEQIKQFFQLPLEAKLPVVNDRTDSQQRGWCLPGEEKTWYLESNDGTIPEPKFSDAKESFDCGDPADALFPNKWPSPAVLPDYRQTLESFFYACGTLTLTLLRLLAQELDLEPSIFTSRCTNEASTIRINHFPPIKREVLDTGATSRIWPHNDFGIISLVFPSTVPGLEYENRDRPGTFLPMPYESEEEVVVILGETLQRWTNGQIRAGLHRVGPPKDVQGEVVPERWSLVFFNKADRHVRVGPLKESVDVNGGEPLYEDLSALEYQGSRNRKHYPDEG